MPYREGQKWQLGVAVHSYNPRTRQAESEGP